MWRLCFVVEAAAAEIVGFRYWGLRGSRQRRYAQLGETMIVMVGMLRSGVQTR
jgi:hypothetical protein